MRSALIPVLMPSGVVRRGHVGTWMFAQNNLFLQTADLTSAAGWNLSRVTASAPAGITDPYGNQAFLVRENNADGAHHHSTAGRPVEWSGVAPLVRRVLAKRESGDINLSLTAPTGASSVPIVDLATGALLSGSGTVRDLGGGWYEIWYTQATAYMNYLQHLLYNGTSSSWAGRASTGTAQAGAASTITLASGASATDDLYNGASITITGGTGAGQTRLIDDYDGTTKVATVDAAWDTQPDATSTYATHAGVYLSLPQFSRGSTPPAFVHTTDLQSRASLLGGSIAMVRGGSTGNTTNDYSLDGYAAVFATDDFGISASALPINPNGPFTAIIVGKYTGTTGTILALGADANNYHAIYHSADDAVGIASKDAGGETTSASALATADASAIALCLRSDGATLTLTRLDTWASVTHPAETAVGAPYLSVGGLANASGFVDALTCYGIKAHAACLSDSELRRDYKWIKAEIANRTRGGVTVL